MKKITKMFFAMALILCCAMSASAAGYKTVMQYNFDGGESGAAWVQGDATVVDGCWVLTNAEVAAHYSQQACFSAPSAFEIGGSYALTMKIRGEEPGSIHALLQYNDGSSYPATAFPLIEFTNEWTEVKVKVTNTVENASDFMLQWGDYAGTIYIDEFELSVYSESDEVITGANPDLRWVNVLSNSDMEGEELASFWKTENNPAVADTLESVINAPISAEIGKDGSRGIMVSSYPSTNESDEVYNGIADSWAAQFFVAVPEQLPQGTSYKMIFDYRASTEVTAETQAHKEPGTYNHWSMIGSPAFTTDWQTYTAEGKLDANQANGYFKSVAFNLHINKKEQVDFYFDNVYFYVQNNGLVPQYCNEVILMDLARTTNIPALVSATGKSRLVYPEGCVTVTADGEEVGVISVEAFADGRFYVFTDMLEDDAEIKVKFTNPADPAYRIVYTDGDLSELPDYDGVAYLNENVEVEDAIYWEYAAPEVMSISPEDGSFNLPVTFNEIKVTFDKGVNCEDLVAWLGNETLVVSPATGYAESITLTRSKTGDLAEGEYLISIEKIHSDKTEGDATFWGSVYCTVTVGLNDAGKELMADLETALNSANNAKTAAENADYAGVAYDDLCKLIDAYDEEYKSLTSPSECRDVTKVLSNAAIAMDNHRKLVDNYYNTVNGGISARDSYSESKFAKMPEFITFKEDLAKYLNEAGEPIKLYEDAALQAAVDALSPIVNDASKLFTEGPSKYGTTGIAALVERLRLGAETLKVLGVSESDELVVAALNALDDDDNLAEQLKLRVKAELYKAIKDGKDKDLFKDVMNDVTLENEKSTVDMTVFFKNPNIYNSDCSVGDGLGEGAYDPALMPGWTVPEGAAGPKYAVGTYNVAAPHKIADGTFLQWQSGFQIEQSVNDLPAGVYTIKSSFSERVGDDMNSFFYVQTSATPAGEYAGVDSVESKGDAPTNDLYLSVNDVVVVDGFLTVGVLAGPKSCTHFNAISVQMSGAAADFDYAAAYKEIADGIEGTVAAPAKVLGIQLYDLNGRRIMNAQKGIVILKKFMSDGTIQVEKVIKK